MIERKAQETWQKNRQFYISQHHGRRSITIKELGQQLNEVWEMLNSVDQLFRLHVENRIYNCSPAIGPNDISWFPQVLNTCLRSASDTLEALIPHEEWLGKE